MRKWLIPKFLHVFGVIKSGSFDGGGGGGGDGVCVLFIKIYTGNPVKTKIKSKYNFQ